MRAHPAVGMALNNLKSPDETQASVDRALAIKPNQAEAYDDPADTATLINCLDLVIGVDTGITPIHAWALDKSLWILLPYIPDYRWMVGRNDLP